jgi:hypothetical protein
VPSLPAGYVPGPISVGPGAQRSDHPIESATPTPPPAPVVLTVRPPLSPTNPCASAGVAGPVPVSQSVEVCKP